jgi:hypothetical protein
MMGKNWRAHQTNDTCFTLSVSYVQENLAEHAKIVKKTMAGHKKIN